jgi:hypothetical protein
LQDNFLDGKDLDVAKTQVVAKTVLFRERVNLLEYNHILKHHRARKIEKSFTPKIFFDLKKPGDTASTTATAFLFPGSPPNPMPDNLWMKVRQTV